MEANVGTRPTAGSLVRPALSTQTKGAVKNALAFTLALMVPLAEGWSTQAATAALTVAVIATTSSDASNAFHKGLLRTLGTLLGAAVGMGLIALFPQERMLYLLALSLTAALFLYLTRAYRGDNTLFLLATMTLMLVFKEGEADGVFLYGMERTAMTLWGVVVYTLVWVFLWPSDTQPASSEKRAEKLRRFDWSDPDNFLVAGLGFAIFWSLSAFWILFNPPAGFMAVALATSLSAVMLLSAVTPAMMIAGFSLSFVVATLAYIFVLPRITDGYGLGAFLFLYAFLAHRLTPAPVAMSLLIATSTFHLQRYAFFDFALFLNILLLLYTYLFALLFFYYIPLSSRPEAMLRRAWRRFEKITGRLERERPYGWAGTLVRRYDCARLLPTLEALKFWAAKRGVAGSDEAALKAWQEACDTAARALHAARCEGEHDAASAQKPLQKCRTLGRRVEAAWKRGRF